MFEVRIEVDTSIGINKCPTGHISSYPPRLRTSLLDPVCKHEENTRRRRERERERVRGQRADRHRERGKRERKRKRKKRDSGGRPQSPDPSWQMRQFIISLLGKVNSVFRKLNR